MTISLEPDLHRWSAKWVFLKLLQNSQENNCAGVYFIIKLQVEKFFKIYEKHLYLGLIFIKVTDWKVLQNSQENTCASVSFSIKMQAEKNS